MNLIWLRRASAILALSLALAMTACGGDDKDNGGGNGGGGNNNNNSFTPNSEEQWLGAACACDGSKEWPCDRVGIPVPSGSPVTGCDNVTDVPGAQRICLRTIDEEVKITAPPTLFPEGYCALGAVECTGSNLCKMANYGNVDDFISCPEGSALLGTDFDYELMGDPVQIRARTCVKRCNTDADCRPDDQITCIERNNVKFCYNEFNFKYTGEPMVFAF